MGWQTDFLKAIGAPDTPNNQGNVNAWAACEGGLSNNNPFNTTKGGPGQSGSINSVGVKKFDTLANGVNANVATIQQPNFSPLLNALKKDSSRADFAATLGSVPWGTNPGCVSKASGTPVGGSAAPAAPSGGGSSDSCLAKLPLVGGCILTKSNLKALKAGLLVAAGGGTLAVGVLLVISWGMHNTGAGRAAVRSYNALPGLPPTSPTSHRQPTGQSSSPSYSGLDARLGRDRQGGEDDELFEATRETRRSQSRERAPGETRRERAQPLAFTGPTSADLEAREINEAPF